MWGYVDARKYCGTAMSDMGLMISLDCGVLDSTFPDLLGVVRADLQSILTQPQESNADDSIPVKVFLVIRYLDGSNPYAAKRLKFEQKNKMVYADMVIRSTTVSMRASLPEFVAVVFKALQALFHDIELFCRKKGVRFDKELHLRALVALEKSYSQAEYPGRIQV
jgi:hypothetical protein